MSIITASILVLVISALCKAIRDTIIHHSLENVIEYTAYRKWMPRFMTLWFIGRWKWKYKQNFDTEYTDKHWHYRDKHWYAGILAPISDLWHTCWTIEILTKIIFIIWIIGLPWYWVIILSLIYAGTFNFLYGWLFYKSSYRSDLNIIKAILGI